MVQQLFPMSFAPHRASWTPVILCEGETATAAAPTGMTDRPRDSPKDRETEQRRLTPEQADRLPRVHRLLLGHYGEPRPRSVRDPLTQLIACLLASRTQAAAAQQAMRELERAFRAGAGNWEPVRDASIAEIERGIAAVAFPEQKALRLKALLEEITGRVGALTLEFLARYRTEKIRAWLEQFEGVGRQISAEVVCFSTLRRHALPIDAGHLRVAQRLCLTPRADAATTEERLMRLVPETWDAARLEEHHRLVQIHAQTLCRFEDPGCGQCPLLAVCPSGERRQGELRLTGK